MVLLRVGRIGMHRPGYRISAFRPTLVPHLRSFVTGRYPGSAESEFASLTPSHFRRRACHTPWVSYQNAKTPYPSYPILMLAPYYALSFPFPFPAGLPLFFPCAAPPAACPSPLPSAAFIPSSSCFSIVSSASFLLVRSMTSSVFMTLRPPCLEKTSRSRDVFAVCGVRPRYRERVEM
jgi:hypothetical protein